MEHLLVLLLALFAHLGAQLPPDFVQQATTNFLGVFNRSAPRCSRSPPRG